MNDLDKLFKNKMLDREFEFKDSYWEAAEQLIGQEEQKRRRGGLWWRFGAFLLLFVIAGYFITNIQSATTVSTSEIIDENQNVAVKKEQNVALQEQNLSPAIEIKQGKQTDPTFINAECRTPDNQESNRPTIQQTVSSYESITPPIDLSKKGVSKERSTDAVENIPALDVKKIDVQLPGADTIAQQPVEKTKQKLEVAGNSVKETSTIAELALLPFKPSELTIPEADCDGCFDMVKLKYKPKRFAFALAAESVYFLKGSLKKSWYGASVGGVVEYQFIRKMALRSGLQVARIQYNGQKSESESEREIYLSSGSQSTGENFSESANQYSFGLRTINSYYNPKSIYQLELPLSIQFRHRRHAIEVGAQLSMLLGVRGSAYSNSSLFPWEQASLETTAPFLIMEETGTKWLPDNNLKKYTTNLKFGYEYSVTPRFAINLSSYFSLSSNSPPLDDGNGVFSSLLDNSAAESNVSDDKGRFHFRVGAKWYFKK